MRTVWLLNHYAVSPREAGGTRHYSLAKYLIDHDWDMPIIAASTDHNTGKSRFYSHQIVHETCNQVDFFYLPCPEYKGNGLRRVLNMLAYFYHAVCLCFKKPNSLSVPDVIIGSSVHPLAALAAYILSIRFKVPFVFEIRDLWPESLVVIGKIRRNSIIAKVMYGIESFLLSKAKKVISLLPGVPEYIKSKGYNSEKCIWISNGIDLVEFDQYKVEVTTDLGSPDWNLTLMYVGAMGHANELFTLLDGFSAYQKIFPMGKTGLILVGAGPLKQALQRYVEKKGIKRVNWHNPLPKKKLPSILQNADAFIITVKNMPELYRYGISMNKIFDYMASEKPTIIACSALNNPIAECGGGNVVQAGDIEGISKAIHDIECMPEYTRKNMGKLARNHVTKEYDFKNLSIRLSSFLNNMVEE